MGLRREVHNPIRASHQGFNGFFIADIAANPPVARRIRNAGQVLRVARVGQ